MKAGASSRGTLILALPVLGLLVWLVLYPNLFVMGDSLMEGGELTLRWYRDFVGSRARMEALRGSVWISLASVVTSGLVGIPLAFLLWGGVVGWIRRLQYRLQPGDLRWLALPLLVNVAFIMVAADLDGLIVFMFKHGFVPGLVLLVGVQWAAPAVAPVRPAGSGGG